MAALQDLRRRIRSIGNIEQITRAMEMVAITKLRRFQERALAARPYTEDLLHMLGRLAAVAGPAVRTHPLFVERPAGAVGILLVTSDRGLCGPYNANVIGKMEEFVLERKGSPARFFVVGRKGYAHLARSGREVARYFAEPPLEKLDFAAARRVAKTLVDALVAGEVSEVHAFTTQFVSMVTTRARGERLLPIDPMALLGEEKASVGEGDTIFEPDAGSIFAGLVPRTVETEVYQLLLESLTSEYASRRVSMKNATEAAEDMRGELGRRYNRARQEKITKELLEIAAGAEALRAA